MPGKHLVLLLLALGVRLSSAASSPKPPRGVAPNDSDHYVAGPGNTFQCLDGSVTLAFDRVNDDFCDCPDGSDEPGTSACPNGRFYCRNRGHVSKTLASAFVNDGICDCCDGSDEERGCNNFCVELGSAARLEKAALLKEYKAGAVAREQLLRDAKVRRESWLQQEALLSAKVEDLRPRVAELQEIKDKLRAERDALLPAGEEQDSSHVEDGVEEEDPVEWHDPRDPSQWEEDDPEHEAYHEAGGDAADEESGDADYQAEGDEEEDPEEVGRRIAAQWTSDPEAAVKQRAGAAAQQDPDAGQQCTAGDQQCGSAGRGAEEVAAAADEALAASDDTEHDPASDAKPAGGFLKSVRDLVGGMFGKNGSATEEAAPEDVDAAQKLREDAERRYQEAEQNYSREQDVLTEAETSLADVQAKLKRDHGPGDLFSYLDGSCYESTEGKYTYSICGFGDARQREGQTSTMLGKFAGFENHHNTVTYTQGDVCWQGPARSLRVELKCGATTQLHSVTEPSRCQYASVLVTPAACSPDIVAALAAEVAALEEEVASIEK